MVQKLEQHSMLSEGTQSCVNGHVLGVEHAQATWSMHSFWGGHRSTD